MTAKRRGVSPVIATLLIVIAVAAALLTYIWVTGYIGRTTSTAEASQLQERIKINAVQVQQQSGAYNVSISVANIGDVQVTITAAYVLTEGGTQQCGGDINDVPISTGSIGNVQVTGCSLNAGSTYIAKVVTTKVQRLPIRSSHKI